MHRLHELAPDFRVIELPPGPPPSAAVEARIAQIWAQEAARRGARLFNGRIYSLVEHAPDRLAVRAMEYRHVLALQHAPELAAQGLALRPLGVTGLLRSPDGIVLGRRAAHLAVAAGLWETAPAGGLDRLDPVALLLEELHEELGLAAAEASVPRPLVLIEDGTSGVLDIVFRIETALGAAAIRAAHGAVPSDEYSELAVVAPDALPAFLAARPDAFLPIVPAILRLAGLLPA
ncbi:MAG TPA: hypothetical protein VFA22_07655 [Stellaceae bacterium]|nr:hypothetical protein [Stellaceae bacterium]